MPERLVALAAEAGEPVPEHRSAARALRARLPRRWPTGATCAPRPGSPAARLDVVHVVGGGSQNALLCQLTADACGLPVLAGPTEAAALGNVLVQARALGADLPDLAAMRALVRRTHDLAAYDPQPGHDWDAAEARVAPPRRTTPMDTGPMKVALMVTCVNDAMFPDTGKAVVRLLRRLGVDVEFPAAQTCCAQPMVNTGYLDEAVPVVRDVRRGLRGLRRDRHPVAARAPARPATSTRIVARRSGDAGAGRRRGARPRPRSTSSPSSSSTSSA